MEELCPYCEGSLSIYNNKYICNDCSTRFKKVKGKIKAVEEEY